MTFGQPALLQGFDFLVAVIGLFGLGEILLTMEEGLSFKGKSAKIDSAIVWKTWKTLPRYWATSVRACLVGCWMGITPAARRQRRS
jgi:TctA family transporter